MKKMLHVARREFIATAGTKAFVFGVLVTPFLLGLLLVALPRVLRESPPNIEGEVAIVDPTGQVAAGLRTYLEPERIAERRAKASQRLIESLPPALRTAAGQSPGGAAQMDQALKSALGEVPHLAVVALDAATDLEASKQPLKDTPPPGSGRKERLALIVVHPDAVIRSPGKSAFGTYDLFVRGKLDDRVETEIKNGVRDAIVAARVRQSGMDRGEIDALTTVDRVTSRTVTAAGEDATNRVLNQIMPAVFMALLLVSVMMSGQYLLTTTVEEKANRVAEVLLSAISPMQLMAGKIIGQLAVGLLVLALYMGLGLLALVSFATIGLLDPTLIAFLFVFFLLAYVTVGSLMAAIGSAVNEMREAQGLMTPIMLIIMIPWILWLPISRDPNSIFATALSFLPPVGNFVMMLRLASTSPPPLWEALAAIVVGALGGWGSLWFAGKVFRVGVLMHGKPPNIATLIRWARTG